MLNSLPVVQDWPPFEPYIRDDYDGDGWADADRDCVNTRHEVLQRDSRTAVTVAGCSVVAGDWIDRSTCEELTQASEVTFDHFVPLARSSCGRMAVDRHD